MARPAGIDRRLATTVVATLLASVLAGCGSREPPTAESPGAQPSPRATGSPTPSPTGSPSPRLPSLSGRPIVGGAPPAWLGTRVLPLAPHGFGEVRPTPPELVERRFTLPDKLPALPGDGFASRVTAPAPARVLQRSTWRRGCPVAAADLSWVRLAFWGFDGRRHTGELLVNRSAAAAIVTVFRRLYAARFPIEEMRITRRDELAAPPTGDGNSTGAFVCRPTTGGASYPEHGYGLAVDLNPFQNPCRKDDVVLPELASAYLERAWVRPGMITPGGPAVRAFAAAGWTWGGSWKSQKDYQHFSSTGR